MIVNEKMLYKFLKNHKNIIKHLLTAMSTPFIGNVKSSSHIRLKDSSITSIEYKKAVAYKAL